jgi:predicted transposase YbfD/YdcC
MNLNYHRMNFGGNSGYPGHELIQSLNLSGCIVTIDAMGYQKNIAHEIIKADVDYVLALKGNHGIIHEEVKEYFDDAIHKASFELINFQSTEKDHGRIETRKYWQSDNLSWFADRSKWEGLKSIGMVESTRQIKNEVQFERRYYSLSMPMNVVQFAQAVRSHWGVKNQLHWVLDVQMREDESRARTGYASENLAILRRLVLNLLKKEQTKKRGIKGKQKNAGWDHHYLLKLLGI